MRTYQSSASYNLYRYQPQTGDAHRLPVTVLPPSAAPEGLSSYGGFFMTLAARLEGVIVSVSHYILDRSPTRSQSVRV